MTEEPDQPRPDDERALADAVDEAVAPVTHEAVMAMWERTVLGRLQHPDPPHDEVSELLRRLQDGEPPDPGDQPPDAG